MTESKCCTKCGKDLPRSEFYPDITKKTGLHSRCKACESVALQSDSARAARRRYLASLPYDRKLKRRAVNNESRNRAYMPPWASIEKMREIYCRAQEMSAKTGEPHEVDHIIPLCSKIVCGLHHEDNLQILRREENREKGRTFGKPLRKEIREQNRQFTERRRRVEEMRELRELGLM